MNRLLFFALKSRVLSLVAITLVYRLLCTPIIVFIIAQNDIKQLLTVIAISLATIVLSVIETLMAFYEKDAIAFAIFMLDLCMLCMRQVLFSSSMMGIEVIAMLLLSLQFLYTQERNGNTWVDILANTLFCMMLVLFIFYKFMPQKLGYQFTSSNIAYWSRVFYTLQTCLLLLYSCFSLQFIINRDEKKMHHKNDVIAYEADHDPLTGLMNRRRTYVVLDKLQEEKDKKGFDFVISIFDIDDFKKFNEAYGHACGDYALKTFTKRILDELPPDTKLGRWGGEEFIIVFMFYNQQIPFNLDEIRQRVSRKPLRYEGKDLYVTATFGISSSKQLGSYEAAITDADNNLLEGKMRGKNKIKISSQF